MNKKVFIGFILLAALVVSGLGSCLTNQGPVDTHNSRISLDWDGVYAGTIPAADGPGIDVRIKLNRDQSFEMTYVYLERSGSPLSWAGSFQWDNTGSIITLDVDNNTPKYYKVAENMLIQLDMKGKLIKGKLADNYKLKKVL